MLTFPFLTELILRVAENKGLDPGLPEAEVLREVALDLDQVLLSSVLLAEYRRQLDERLDPMLKKFYFDHATDFTKLAETPYFVSISNKLFDEIVEIPLQMRDLYWFSKNRIDLLALNFSALTLLHEEISARTSEAWIELTENEHELRRIGLPAPSEMAFGLETQYESVRSADIKAKEDPPLTMLLRIPVEDLNDLDIINPLNLPSDEVTVVINYRDREIAITTGGAIYVGDGCNLVLEWLLNDGISRNDPSKPGTGEDVGASASATSSDDPIRLKGNEYFDEGQYLRFRFERTGHRAYKISGLIKIEES